MVLFIGYISQLTDCVAFCATTNKQTNKSDGRVVDILVYSKEPNTQSFSLSFLVWGGQVIQKVNVLAEALVNTDSKYV